MGILDNGTTGNDSIFGSDSNPFIFNKDDTLSGQAGDDTIFGGSGNDIVDGGSGVDSLFGGTGDDTINGGFSADIIFGGDGNDLITFKAGEFFDSVDGGNGNDTLDASGATSSGVYNFQAGTISGFGVGTLSGIETFFGSTTVGDTIISDGSGTFFGQGGNDTMTAGLGVSETLDGGTGIDTLITTPFTGGYNINLATGVTNFAGESLVGFENLTTGGGNDTLTGTGGDNVIDGGAGNDLIDGAGGADTIFGGSGDDTLNGGFVADAVFGGDGNDLITFKVGQFFDSVDGGNGNDTLDASGANANGIFDFQAGIISGFGGGTVSSIETFLGSNTNNDTIISNGSNTYFGQGGDDTMTAGLGGAETLDGGTGIDTLITTPFSGTYVVNLTTGLTNFGGEFYANFENLTSGAGNDSLTGTSGDNVIDGGSGNDTIDGGGGTDKISGNLGDDVINGGFSADSIFGGDGNDLITFKAGEFFDAVDGGAGNDTIDATAATNAGFYDFQAGTITGFGVGTVTGVETLLASDSAGDTIVSDGSGRYFGQGGNDTMTAGLGTLETLDGGLGIDTLITTPFTGDYAINLVTGLTNFTDESFVGFENLTSGAGNDTLTGSSLDNIIDGAGGEDLIEGGSGTDTLTGGTGNDTLNGGFAADAIFGGDGNDLITFKAGEFFDSVDGGVGTDTLDATGATSSGVYDFQVGTISGFGGGTVSGIERFLGSNTVGDTIISSGLGSYFGQGGNDTMTAGLGAPEALSGGAGVDTLITTPFNGDYAVNLTTGLTNFAGERFTGFENLISGAGNDTLTGTAGANRIDGGLGNDIVVGGGANDTLIGNGGNDALQGGVGADNLTGGIGKDVLRGDAGNDIMTGGPGNDRFVFNAGFGHDVINDFSAGAAIGDVMNFVSLGITLSNLTLTSANGGADTLVTVTASGDSVLLHGVGFGTLFANDFAF